MDIAIKAAQQSVSDCDKVSISSTFTQTFFLRIFLAPKLTKLCYELENFGAKKFRTKSARVKVDEIDCKVCYNVSIFVKK